MALSALRKPMTAPVGTPSQEVIQIQTWTASLAYVVGQIICSGTIQNPGHYYQCTVAGTSGSSAPAWPTNGTTVSDGGATWQDIGQGYGGDMSQGSNGLARYLTGLQPLANQLQATFSYVGLLTATKASATTAADGAAIYYDFANAIFVSSAPANGFYAGTARGAWVSGQTTGVLLLNGPLSLTNFAGGALTLTGALIAESTFALTGAATLSSTLAVTGAATLSGGAILAHATLAASLTGTPAQLASQVNLVTTADATHVYVKLPNPATWPVGKPCVVVNTGGATAETITVDPYAAESVGTTTIAAGKQATFYTDGTNWFGS